MFKFKVGDIVYLKKYGVVSGLGEVVEGNTDNINKIPVRWDGLFYNENRQFSTPKKSDLRKLTALEKALK